MNEENIDFLFNSGIYWFNEALGGTKPYSDYGQLIVISFLVGSEIQIMFPYNVSIRKVMWRGRANNTWGEWTEF